MSGPQHASPTDDLIVSDTEVRGGVVRTLTLSRPETLNALLPELTASYLQALRDADADRRVRAIIVTGAGRAFSSGADLGVLDRLAADPAAAAPPALPLWLALGLATPVITAIRGPAVGMGLVLALFADVRIAADDAVLTTAFARRGLVAEWGLAWWLPQLVGAGRARELLLSGRSVGAAEAAAIGLVDQVVPADALQERAVHYAADLVEHGSPASFAVMKRQLLEAAPGGRRCGLDAAYRASLEDMAASFARPDLAEAVAAFRERRLPEWPAADRAGLPT